MRYHGACFSGFADPRSQASSSHHIGRLAGTQYEAAPTRASGKMRTGTHFDSGGHSRYQAGATGKLAGYGCHGGGFSACSSKPTAGEPLLEESAADQWPKKVGGGDSGGLTEAGISEHLKQMQASKVAGASTPQL